MSAWSFTHVTEITVNNETDSGAAVIEIRGFSTSDTRFRLYDISADKYLTKRGWTKTPSALPTDAVLSDDVITITLDAELTRKIFSRASLSLEQPGSDFRQVFLWPESGVPAAPVVIPSIDEPIPVEAALADLGSVAPGLAAETTEPKPEPVATAKPVAAIPAKQSERRDTRSPATPGLLVDDGLPQTWLPTAIAAALFLVLGFGIAYFLLGSGSDAQVKQVTQAAAAARAKDQADFAKKLADAEAASKDTAAKIAEAGTKTADLTAARDAALKEVTDKDNKVRNLQTKLDAATTEIESFKATGQKIDARVAELTTQAQTLAADRDAAFKTIADKDAALKDLEAKLNDTNSEIDAIKNQAGTVEAQQSALTEKTSTLAAALDKAKADLAGREKTLRDVQSKLEVANVQIDALKTMAAKNSEASLEKSALQDKIAQLTADLDASTKAASASTTKLADLNQRLAATETKLAAATSQPDSNQQAAADAPPDETTSQLQEERDLYAKELKTLTDSFTTLKAQKAELEKQLASRTEKASAVAKTDEAPEAANVTLWGATAIDMGGAIYAVNNQTTKKAAQNGAKAKCRSQSDFGCQALTSFQNSCISVARFEGEGPAADNYAFSVHPNWKRAAAEALGRCERMGQKCTVRFTSCSPDSLSK
jgi:predicted  nucleic acid-binding Zn-ribbon protein